MHRSIPAPTLFAQSCSVLPKLFLQPASTKFNDSKRLGLTRDRTQTQVPQTTKRCPLPRARHRHNASFLDYTALYSIRYHFLPNFNESQVSEQLLGLFKGRHGPCAERHPIHRYIGQWPIKISFQRDLESYLGSGGPGCRSAGGKVV